MKRRLLSLLLAFLMLAAWFTSCSESAENSDDIADRAPETTADAPAAETIEDETEDETADNLPAITFDGKAYNLLTDTNETNQFIHEEYNGEVINDAVYDQVVTVEDRFDMDFTAIPVGDPGTVLQSSIQGGDNAYQSILYANASCASLAYRNILMNLNDFDYIDFSKPWWSQNINDVMTVNGKIFTAFGDYFAHRAIYNLHMLYFNKDLLGSYTTESPYEYVRSGQWTLDTMLKLTEGTAVDLDGDGTMDFDDQWGFIQSDIQSSVITYTCGVHILVPGEDGLPKLDFNNERTIDIFNKVYSFDFDNPSVYTVPQADESNAALLFKAGQAVFYSGFFNDCAVIREMEDSLGILPFPKYDEESEYINWLTGGNALLALPISIRPEDYDFVGIITEAIGAEGFRRLRPAVYETTLQGKLARDADSVEMIDLIYATTTTDLGWLYDDGSGLAWFCNKLIQNRLTNFASLYQSFEKRAVKLYDKLADLYAD